MLRIYDVSLQLVRDVAPLAREIARHDADLAKQLRRALSSVPLNIAEGSYAQGGRRGSSYRVAMASAREALACLETSQAWGHTAPVPPRIAATFHHVIGTLHNIVTPH